MKRIALIIFLIIFVSLSGCSNEEEQSTSPWKFVGARGFSDGQASWIAIDTDADGVPFVAYRDEGNQGKLTVQRYSGNQWETLGVKGLTADKVSHICLDVYGNDVYVAYRDFSVSGKASLLKYDNTGWSFIGQGFTEENLPDSDPFNDISLDGHYNRRLAMHVINENMIYVACVSETGFTGPYAYRYNGSWGKISTGLSTDADTDDLALFGLSSSAIYLAYSQDGNGYYTRCTETAWSTATPFTSQGGRSFSIKLNNDNLYVAYSAIDGDVDFSGPDSEAAPDKVYVKDLLTTGMPVLGDAAVSQSTGTEVTLAFDSQDRALVCYADWSGVCAPTIQRFNGTSWEILGQSIINSGTEFISFTVHYDTPFVAFKDGDYQEKLTVMTYSP